jgi:hypothetical protein
MTHRTDRIHLPADVARCEPAGDCPLKHDCKRYMAAVPQYGSMIGADLPPPMFLFGPCPFHLPLSLKTGTIKPAKKAKPAVKGMA